MKEDIEKCLEAGMDEHISKPFQQQAIYSVLGRLARGNALASPAGALPAVSAADIPGPVAAVPALTGESSQQKIKKPIASLTERDFSGGSAAPRRWWENFSPCSTRISFATCQS